MTAAVRLFPGGHDNGFSLGFAVARLLPHFLVGTLARPAEDLAADDTFCRPLSFEYWSRREALGATRSRPCTDVYRDPITHSGRSD